MDILKKLDEIRKKGLLHLVPADGPARLDCLADKCARCCRFLSGPKVDKKEAERIGAEHIEKIGNAFFIKSKNSTCTILKNNLCSRYPDRPKGCREYPWYNIDGKLYYDAGCPGMKIGEDGRPDVKDIQPFENFFPNAPKEILPEIKKLCTEE